MFSFLLLLLVFCTLLAPKVEEEMATLVDARKKADKTGRGVTVGSNVVEWKNTDDRLFILVEGNGWESGLRISEIPSKYFDDSYGRIVLAPGMTYWYIHSATREPVAGDPVRVVETKQGEDVYLFWHPEGITDLSHMTNVMQVEARAGNAALIRVRGATFPFCEHNLWYRFQSSMGREICIYSLHDIQQFAEALPWIARTAAVLLCGLILLGGSWLLSGRTGGRKAVWAVNLLLIAALLPTLLWLLRQFDLPASLMPRESILDLAHYRETFTRIVGAMDAMDDHSVREALERAGTDCALSVGLGVLVPAAVVTVEGLLCKRRARKEKP